MVFSYCRIHIPSKNSILSQNCTTQKWSWEVKKIYTKIQNCRKCNPNQIGNQNICRAVFYHFKFKYCCNNKNPKNDYPYKCKQIVVSRKENKAPNKIKEKLNVIYSQSSAFSRTACVFYNISGKTH